MVVRVDDDKQFDSERILFFTDLDTAKKTQPNPRMMLFLDTATRYTGYAFFEQSVVDPAKAMLAGYGLFKAPAKMDSWERCLVLTSKVSNIIHTTKPGKLIMEFPTFQGGEKGTHASRSGGTLQLAYLCGRIAACWEFYLGMIYAHNKRAENIEQVMNSFGYAMNIPYHAWNGQRPKKVTCERCEEFLGLNRGAINPSGIDNNWVDAMMMGVWYCKKKLLLTPQSNPEAVRIDL